MLTICVPTMDRSPFVRRLLAYYASTGFRHWIFIGDSSCPEHAAQNRTAAAMLQDRLKIVYRECPGLSSCGTVEQLNTMVSTPYCVLQGDDDFLCPTGLERCVAFLEAHPEYGAAHGQGLRFQTESNGPHGPIGTVASYPQATLEAPTGAQRLLELFTVSLATLLSSVHRTPTWQAMFRGLTEMPGIRNRNVFKDELIATCVSVIRGRVKALDGLSLIRQTHTEDSYRFPHVYDWLTDPDWFPSYQVFHDRLVEELIRQDGVNREQALAEIRRAFWAYMKHEVIETRKKEERSTPRRAASRLRTWAKRIPGVRRTWRAVRAQIQRQRDEHSLPALLSPSSPSHADFLPVYSVVTNEPPLITDGQVTTDARPGLVVVGAE